MGLINFIHLKFQQGGYLEMFAITGVLFLSIAIIIERAIRLSKKYAMPDASQFMQHVQKLVMNNSIENAIRHCKNRRQKLLAFVLAEGLKRANDTPEEIENAIESAILTVSPKVTKRVGFLATTANVATLLGLLGTIHGLMRSFGALGTLSGEEKQEALAAGISQALNATFYGLGTALLCLLAYGILSMMQKSILDDINKYSARLVDLLYTRRIRIRSAKSN